MLRNVEQVSLSSLPCGTALSLVADFQPKSVEQDLNRLLDEFHSGSALRKSPVHLLRCITTTKCQLLNRSAAEFELKQAMSALSALLVYLSLLADASHLGQFRIYRHDLSQYMKLDASAVKALNLMPSPSELGGNKNMSLYGLLNRCKTAQGQRLLARWLKQPLVNLHEICKSSVMHA